VTSLPFKPLVWLPADLTVRFGREALTAPDGGAWCAQKAAALLGAGARGKDVSRLTRCLEEHLEIFRKDMPLVVAAICFYPDYETLPPRAAVVVKAFVGDPDYPGDLDKGLMTMDMAREFYAKPDGTSMVGETELTESEVPAGQALRAHRYRKVDPGKRRSKIMEEIAWLVWPPDTSTVVIMTTHCEEPAFSEAAAVIADGIARNFRVEPKD
jgi:hypothetical protein